MASLLFLLTFAMPAAAGMIGAPPDTPHRLAGGLAHSLVVKGDGTLWTFGFNDCGQLGTGDTNSRNLPTQIMTGVKSALGGRGHSLVLKSDGTLWTFGANYCGQLGTGDTADRHIPTQVMDGVTAIGTGRDHCLALKTDGSLWAFGANARGQLGTGDTVDRHSPVKIMDNVASMSGGVDHSLVVKTDGTLWTFGWNYYGQLGTGDTVDRLTPVQVMTGVRSVCSRFASSFALKDDGTVWSFGLNDGGQLGTGDNNTKLNPVPVISGVTQISTGWYHTLALKRTGELWGFGSNDVGQLGTGDTTKHFTPVPIMSNVTAIGTTAASSSLALKADGTVWAFGLNYDGQLGTGDTQNRYSPVQIMQMDPITITIMGYPCVIYDGSPCSFNLSELGVGAIDQYHEPFNPYDHEITWKVISGNATVSGDSLMIEDGNPVTVTAMVEGVESNAFTITPFDPSLSDLAIGSGEMSPAFSPSTIEYSAHVGYDQKSIAVTPTAHSNHATITINGEQATSGTAFDVPLKVGANTIAVEVSDRDEFGQGARKTYSVTVTREEPVIALDPTEIPSATVYEPYAQTISAEGGASPYAWTEEGALPAGISFSDGTISGTPTESGTFPITVTATDADGFSGIQKYTLTVEPPTIALGPSDLPSANLHAPYNQAISAGGGAAPYALTEEGTLPAGTTFENGILSGTPTATGTFTFTVTATDAGGFTGARTYTLTVNPPIIGLNPAELPAATVKTSYSQSVTASGGTAPYTYALSGRLPAGMKFAKGVLSGKPTVTGSYPITITATDAEGYSGSRSYTLQVNAPTIVMSPSELSTATAGVRYNQKITATGGRAPYKYTLSGTLPAGMKFINGILLGTPTVAGTFPITVTATDGDRYTGSKNYVLVVNAPVIALSPTGTTLQQGSVGKSYTVVFTANGGSRPYTFRVSSGALPDGLTLQPRGIIYGKPKKAGSFVFSVTATDRYGFVVTNSYVISVK